MSAGPSSAELDALLAVQEHDARIDQLDHQRTHHPARAELAALAEQARALAPELAAATERHAELGAGIKRLEDEVASLTAKAAEAERTLYSGTVTSPRELQALQAEVDQLAKHRRSLEDRELELMEQQESAATHLAAREDQRRAIEAAASEARERLATAEAEIRAEIAREQEARAAAIAPVPEGLVRAYEQRRAAASNGVGIARLVGGTCQACRLSIPAIELDRIRRGEADGLVTCDHCGAILVP